MKINNIGLFPNLFSSQFAPVYIGFLFIFLPLFSIIMDFIYFYLHFEEFIKLHPIYIGFNIILYVQVFVIGIGIVKRWRFVWRFGFIVLPQIITYAAPADLSVGISSELPYLIMTLSEDYRLFNIYFLIALFIYFPIWWYFQRPYFYNETKQCKAAE